MGPSVLTHTQTTPKKAYERYQGYLMGRPSSQMIVTCPLDPALSCCNLLTRGRLTTHGAPGQ
ncbi:unnamed protein product [Staurois parvus]|uniref:Uncharacterized protein n=1 Tax=Staurois parvus TaxID=386267 RepID=A0ABN9BY45_9NEOB|nr:unnamed protein product [Staurois parvus]